MITFTSIAVFLFFAIALIVPSGSSVGAVLLLFGSAALLRKHVSPALRREEMALIAVLFLYFFVNSLINLLHSASGSEYDSPSRFLLVIPVLLLLRVFPPKPDFFWGGLAVGAILSGLFAAWQVFFAGYERAEGYTNPIQFGNISLLLGVLCIAGLGWAASQRRATCWQWLMGCAICLGLLGSFLSGSRGSWVSLLVVLPIAYFCYGGALGLRRSAISLGALVLLFGVLQVLPQSSVEQRIRLAIAEVIHYEKSGDSTTAVGARLEMWRAGLLLIPQRPWLGWGKADYLAEGARMVAAGEASIIVVEHTHLHNEYIDALVKRGAAGLTVLLALYLVPLALFSRRLRDQNSALRPYALAGVLLVVCYLGFGLTQAFLTHNNGVLTLAFMLAILWALLCAQEGRERNPSSTVRRIS